MIIKFFPSLFSHPILWKNEILSRQSYTVAIIDTLLLWSRYFCIFSAFASATALVSTECSIFSSDDHFFRVSRSLWYKGVTQLKVGYLNPSTCVDTMANGWRNFSTSFRFSHSWWFSSYFRRSLSLSATLSRPARMTRALLIIAEVDPQRVTTSRIGTRALTVGPFCPLSLWPSSQLSWSSSNKLDGTWLETRACLHFCNLWGEDRMAIAKPRIWKTNFIRITLKAENESRLYNI